MAQNPDPRFERAKALIQSKKYQEARALLEGINTPRAKQWLAKLAERELAAKPIKAKIGMKRIFVWIWGILVLLSCGWIVYGIALSGQAFTAVVGTPVPGVDAEIQAAGIVGAGLGAGAGVTFFLCTGGPVFLIALLFYVMTSGRIRREQQHAELLNATRGN